MILILDNPFFLIVIVISKSRCDGWMRREMGDWENSSTDCRYTFIQVRESIWKRYIAEEKSRGGGRAEFNRVEFRGIEKEEVTFAIDRVELR